MRSQLHASPGSSFVRIAALPAWCAHSIQTSVSSLPACAYSGQYCETGAFMSSSPRAASTCAHRLVAPFVDDATTAMVSSFHGAPVSGSAVPPQRSTTVFAVERDAHRRADLTAFGEVARELLAHGFELGHALTLDLDRDFSAHDDPPVSVSASSGRIIGNRGALARDQPRLATVPA